MPWLLHGISSAVVSMAAAVAQSHLPCLRACPQERIITRSSGAGGRQRQVQVRSTLHSRGGGKRLCVK